MRTVTFKSVLHGLARRLGMDPDANLQQNTADALAEYINARVKIAWEIFPWPELTRLELRPLYPLAATQAQWNEGDVVYDPATAAYYTAQQITTASAADLADPSLWTPGTPPADGTGERAIPLTAQSYEDIGQVFAVYRCEADYALGLSLDYKLRGDTIAVSAAAEFPWVEYQTRPSQFTAAPWSAETAYAPGDLVYSGEDCWASLSDTTNQMPSASSPYWKLQPLPAVFSTYVKRASMADALGEAGQTDKSGIEERAANDHLDSEMAKLSVHQHQNAGYSVQ